VFGHVRFPSAVTSTNDAMPWRAGALPNTNLNELRSPGFYQLAVATINSPATTGGTTNTAVLQVMSPTNSRITQLFYHNNGNIWRRTLQNTTWTTWERIDGGTSLVVAEGTWTPTWINDQLGSRWGRFMRIGNVVTVAFELNAGGGTVGSAEHTIGGLPFVAADNAAGGGVINAPRSGSNTLVPNGFVINAGENRIRPRRTAPEGWAATITTQVVHETYSYSGSITYRI